MLCCFFSKAVEWYIEHNLTLKRCIFYFLKIFWKIFNYLVNTSSNKSNYSNNLTKLFLWTINKHANKHNTMSNSDSWWKQKKKDQDIFKHIDKSIVYNLLKILLGSFFFFWLMAINNYKNTICWQLTYFSISKINYIWW